jgi:hypothetical protein
MYPTPRRPPEPVLGPDGLPHCSHCTDAELCPYHAHQVGTALRALKTANRLQAIGDVRYLVARKEEDA